MRIEFQVEEPSMEAALQQLIPRLIGNQLPGRIIMYRGKRDLLKQLPARLRGYRDRLAREDLKIIVLVDADAEDCRKLKARLERMAREAGLRTKSAGDGTFEVVNRVVCCELEAWFFGDPTALRAAFPRLPPNFAAGRRYREPDRIPEAWETLVRLLKRSSYARALPGKIELARRVAAEMDPARNRSSSFRAFVQAIEAAQSL
jgi:hypothetical protein